MQPRTFADVLRNAEHLVTQQTRPFDRKRKAEDGNGPSTSDRNFGDQQLNKRPSVGPNSPGLSVTPVLPRFAAAYGAFGNKLQQTAISPVAPGRLAATPQAPASGIRGQAATNTSITRQKYTPREDALRAQGAWLTIILAMPVNAALHAPCRIVRLGRGKRRKREVGCQLPSKSCS